MYFKAKAYYRGGADRMADFFSKFITGYAVCDAAESWQYGLQDPASPIAEGIINFHNYLVLILVVIAAVVFWLLYFVVRNFSADSTRTAEKFTHSSLLEIVWTLVPAVVLLFIAIPSFSLLYSLEEHISPNVTLKIIGHQWYWSYEFESIVQTQDNKDLYSLSFDSYLLPESDLFIGSFRLLEVDKRLALPINTHIRLLVTAADVLHSWSIPSFGIKVDACPGRLSQASLFIQREGVYYGQCSEICGVNHGFMPIVVVGITEKEFSTYLLHESEDLEIFNF